LASELFIQEYKQFFGLKTVINRCGVLTGPWQMGKIDQGVVVLMDCKTFLESAIKLYWLWWHRQASARYVTYR
jgi:CDP-paratose 2-epimerase